jgi:hypothetical protein
MDMGVAVIVYLLILYAVSMVVMWYTLREHKIERPPMMMVPFVLPEGYTILGVMDTPKIVCFCIGEDVVEKKEYE